MTETATGHTLREGQRPLIDVIAPHRDDFDHQAAQLIVQFEGMPKMAVAMGPRQTAEIIAGLSRQLEHYHGRQVHPTGAPAAPSPLDPDALDAQRYVHAPTETNPDQVEGAPR